VADGSRCRGSVGRAGGARSQCGGDGCAGGARSQCGGDGGAGGARSQCGGDGGAGGVCLQGMQTRPHPTPPPLGAGSGGGGCLPLSWTGWGAPEACAPSAQVMGALEGCARRVCRDAPPYSAPARGGKRRWGMAPAVVDWLGRAGGVCSQCAGDGCAGGVRSRCEGDGGAGGVCLQGMQTRPHPTPPPLGGKRRWRMAPAVVGRLGAPEARAPSAEVMGALEECACRACRHAPTLPRPRWGREAAVADVSRCRGPVGARRRRALPVRRCGGRWRGAPGFPRGYWRLFTIPCIDNRHSRHQYAGGKHLALL
jgi:hypothetical protein